MHLENQLAEIERQLKDALCLQQQLMDKIDRMRIESEGLE